MKVLPFEIPKASNQALLYQVDRGAAFYGRLHRHEEIQISLILKGSGDLVVADSVHTFGPGQLFLIGGNTPHLFRSLEDSGEVHMITVFFTRQSFGAHFFALEEVAHLGRAMDAIGVAVRCTEVPRSIQDDFAALENAQGVERMVGFLQLFDQIAALKKERLSRFNPQKITPQEGERMGNVLDYAMLHFSEKIRLEEVAAIAHMTPNAFCRYFKAHTAKSFFQFITELRMAHAARLLLEPEKTVLEIAYATGYRNISHFNRTFLKSFGCSPTHYRKRSVTPRPLR